MPKNKHFPSKNEILVYLKDNQNAGKREIAKAFAIKGDDRIFLKQILKELKEEGLFRKRKTKKATSIVKQINFEVPSLVVGVFKLKKGGGIIEPVDNKMPQVFKVSYDDTKKLNNQDLVLIKPNEDNPYSGFAEVLSSYGHYLSTKALPIIAIVKQGIPFEFSKEAKAEARNIKFASMKNRIDLTDIPLVTIDGETAKDFDDAVFAEPDTNPKNKGGWHLVVAIADIAWYVRSQTALDNEAKARGNSVYFAGGVIPMLPKEISNDLCSLKPNENRPCLAVHIWIDAEGKKLKHQFARVMIKSSARLTYKEVQNLIDENKGNDIINQLYGAYQSLAIARKNRETLEVDIPEREIIIDENGDVKAIVPEQRFESHKIVEEFMILANVCAAEELDEHQISAMFRIHEMPTPEKKQHLYDFLKTIGVVIPTGKSFLAGFYNQIMSSVKDNHLEIIVKQMVLRSQSQAKYSPENIGHFGLALSHYVHFTSPIRRYADLLVHRALITALKLGEGELSKQDVKNFEATAEHISMSERKAMSVERETVDRFTALYMISKIDKSFTAIVTGVTTAGLFITLEENGADGLIPMRALPGGRYEFDEKSECLRGDKIFRLGDELDVILKEANPLTGHLLFGLK